MSNKMPFGESDELDYRAQFVAGLIGLGADDSGIIYSSTIKRAVSFLGIDAIPTTKDGFLNLQKRLEEKGIIKTERIKGGHYGYRIKLLDNSSQQYSLDEPYLKSMKLSTELIKYALDAEILDYAEASCTMLNYSKPQYDATSFRHAKIATLTENELYKALKSQGLTDTLVASTLNKVHKAEAGNRNSSATSASCDGMVADLYPTIWLPIDPFAKSIIMFGKGKIRIANDKVQRGKEYNRRILDKDQFRVPIVNLTEESCNSQIIKDTKIIGSPVCISQYCLVCRGDPKSIIVVKGTYGAKVAAERYAREKNLSFRRPYERNDEGEIIEDLLAGNCAAVLKYPQNMYVLKMLKRLWLKDVKMQMLPPLPQVAVVNENILEKNELLASEFDLAFRNSVEYVNTNPNHSKLLKQSIIFSMGNVVTELRKFMNRIP